MFLCENICRPKIQYLILCFIIFFYLFVLVLGGNTKVCIGGPKISNIFFYEILFFLFILFYFCVAILNYVLGAQKFQIFFFMKFYFLLFFYFFLIFLLVLNPKP